MSVSSKIHTVEIPMPNGMLLESGGLRGHEWNWHSYERDPHRAP